MNVVERSTICLVCNKQFMWTPAYCCSGTDCGCRGMPIEPPLCSTDCEKIFYDNMKSDY